jgi:hypothetical protein
MTTWSQDDLHQIAAADDLQRSDFREDRATYGTSAQWLAHAPVRDGRDHATRPDA